MKKEIRISGRSIGDYVIVIPENALEVERYAADELKKYIDIASGTDIAIKIDSEPVSDCEILVGETSRRPKDPSLEEEEYEIAATKGQLSICGGKGRGTLYGVYTYLEKYLGWRWFSIDTELVREEAAREIWAGEVFRQKPYYEYRNCMFNEAQANHELKAKLKFNTAIGKKSSEKLGGSVEYCLHVHTFNRLCPPKVYFEEHPEYYALRDGERKPTQLCLSNPDVLKIVTENALEELRKNKQHFISISQNDNVDYCQCEKCRAVDEEEGSPSGILLRFVNKVAEEIEKEFPDVKVDTLAYTYTRALPKITRPRDNVCIRLCSIECCFRHPYIDETCPDNISFCKDIRDWSAICKELYIWDYCTDFAHYCLPFPNYGVLLHNNKFFAEHNVKGMLSLGNYNGPGADLNQLKTYLFSKLYMDPFMSEDEYNYHMCDFLEGYYGKGWKYIREYIDILLDTTVNIHFDCYSDADDHYREFIKRIDEVLSLFDKAYDLAEGVQKDHVRIARLSVMNIKIATDYEDVMALGGQAKEQRLKEKREYLEECIKYNLRLSENFKHNEDIEEAMNFYKI